jgi:tetratricopeptide (TPR) repeat protein
MTTARAVPSNSSLYVLVAVLLGASLAVQVTRDRGWEPYQPPSGIMWIRSAPLAQRLALSFDALAADIYWMRAVVYFGGQRLNARTRNFDQLYPMLDLVTALDPHFRVAYRFGAIFLAEESPGGAGRPDLAIALLEKGAAQDPRRWEYLQDIGFVYYWWQRDYVKAAEWFQRAARIPGAPDWLAALAATTLAQGGSRDASRQLWTSLRETGDSDWIRSAAQHRLDQLAALDAIDLLNQAVQRYIRRHGRTPTEWSDMVADERWQGLPLDPAGVPFALDRASGTAMLSRSSPLWPLPQAPPGPSPRAPQ